MHQSLFRFTIETSRLQGAPGGRDARTEVMEGTANLHHHIAYTVFEETTGFFEDAETLYTTVDVLDGYAATGQCLICGLLRRAQFATTGFAGRRLHVYSFKRKTKEAQVLHQFTAFRQRVGRLVGNALIVTASATGLAQKQDLDDGVDQ
jgi:hypothetical protein